jgi:hypothetical protein
MKQIFLIAIALTVIVQAYAFRIEYGDNIIISQPVYEDLYIAGGTITINAPVYGDLILAGGTVIINDTVSNDILLVGGTVTFNGYVGDDIRCGGGNLHISKDVKGDVVITGGSVIIDNNVTVGGLMASGGKVTVNGTINGQVKGAFGELFLNGNVAKDIDCRGGQITVNGNIGGKSVLAANDIRVGNNASFSNDVRYWNKKGDLDFKQSLKNAKAVYDASLQMKTGQWYYMGAATVIGLLWYLGMALLMIMIVQYLFSNTMKKAAGNVFDNSLKSLGFGLLFFVGLPIAAVIAFVTVIGVPVGLLLLFGYIFLLLLASVITSVVTANWLNNRNNYKLNFWPMVFAAFGVFILLKLVSLTPFVGWLITGLLVCISFGSILLSIKWKQHAVPAATDAVKTEKN